MDSNLSKWEGPNPWLGLQTYQEGNRLWGRDTEVSTLSDIICNNLAIVVFGKSGIGKSSLIHAGISPEIRNRGLFPINIRLEHNTNISYTSQIKNAVENVLTLDDKLGESFPSIGLWDFFHRHVFYDKIEHRETSPVIFIDQFEEIYTLADADHKNFAQELFEEFADLLNNKKPDKLIKYETEIAISQTSKVSVGLEEMFFRIHSQKRVNYIDESNFHIVISLREDYLYYLERNTSKIPSFKINRFSLQALNRQTANEVITKPRQGLFCKNEANDIISKISTFNDEGKEEIDPTILSIFLFKYFNRKGNVSTDNIINEFYADETKGISNFSLAYLENHLITGEGYRHLCPFNDAISSGVKQEELYKLINSRIITVETRKGHRYIEFSHDVICPIVKSNREQRKIDEQARKLRKRVIAATTLVLFAIILIGSFLYLHYNLQQSRRSLQLSKTKNTSIRAHYMIAQGDVLDAIKLLLNVIPQDDRNGNYSVLPETEQALYEANDSLYSDFACIAILNHPNDVKTAEFSKDSKTIVTASNDGICRLWDARSGEILKELKSDFKNMTSASLNSECSKVITAFNNGMVVIWDIAEGKMLKNIKGHQASVTYACFSSDEQYALTASTDKTVRLWNVQTEKCIDTIVVHQDNVNFATFSSDGKKVVTASDDGSAVIYDLNSHISYPIFMDENTSIEYAEFNYDDTKVAVVTNSAVYIINVPYRKTEKVIKGHDDVFTSATFSPNGKTIATSSHDKTVKLWSIDNGDVPHIYKGHSNTVSDVMFSPDGKFIISTSIDNEARLWNVPHDDRQNILRPELGELAMVSYSPNGKYIAAASVMGQAKVWDTDSMNVISSFKVDERVSSIVFCKESEQVVIISDTGKHSFFNVKTGREIVDVEELHARFDHEFNNNIEDIPEWVYDGHSEDVLYLSKSHDNKLFVSGSADNTVIIWDVESKAILHRLKRHSSEVYFAEFSPDDNYVITASTDGTIKLWNSVNGTEVVTRSNTFSPRYSSIFSPTGKFSMVSDGFDIRLYKHLQPKDLISDFVTRYNMVQLTEEEKEYYSLK